MWLHRNYTGNDTKMSNKFDCSIDTVESTEDFKLFEDCFNNLCW